MKNKEIIKLPATLIDKGQMADGTRKLMFYLNEVTPEDLVTVTQHSNKQGWLVFSVNSFKEEEIPKENAPEFRDEVSPSKRLKNCLFIFWRDHTSKNPDFNTFYSSWMERKIQEIKDKLN